MTTQQNTNSEVNYAPSLALLTVLFFMWGGITALNDILIPHLKAVFKLSYTEAMLIQFSFFTSYFVVSLPAGSLIKKLGYKIGIVIGLSIAAVGALLFYPAAQYFSYPLFLTALFVLAGGITILQVAANPYVAILGKPETSSSRLNLTQAFNSLGTIIAPLVGSYLILQDAITTTAEHAHSVQMPYLVLAAALFILAFVIGISRLPKIETTDKQQAIEQSAIKRAKPAWKYPHLVLGAVAIFFYVGAEVSIGSLLVNYLGLDFIAGLTAKAAAMYVVYYWAGAMIGRFIGSGVLQVVKSNRVLIFNSLGAFFLVGLTIVATKTFFAPVVSGLGISGGTIAMWAIVSVGLFNSIMFPTIFTLSIQGLGKSTSQGSGILVMAIVGGAIIPLLVGILADGVGVQHAFALTLVSYGYIFYYAVSGYKYTGSEKQTSDIVEVTAGVDIGGTYTKLALVSREGEIVKQSILSTSMYKNENTFVKALKKEIEEMIEKSKEIVHLQAIGIGAPNGNYYTGAVEQAPNLNWEGSINFVELMEDYFSVPVVLTNDANAAAIGEMVFGAAQNVKNFVTITLGTGLGSGIVVNGEIVNGADGFAGEIGHTTVIPDGRQCNCGKKGCLETYASATGVVRTVQKLLGSSIEKSELGSVPFNQLNSKMIWEAAKKGDRLAQEAFEYTGKLLGMKLADTVAHLSPEIIFLTGGLSNAGEYIFEPTRKYLEENLMDIFKGKVQVLPSGITENPAVMGAAALAWKKV